MTASAPLLARRELVEPTFWTCPHGVRVRPEPSLTFGPEVADLCAKAGYAPDPQQELGLDLVFAIRADGSPASFAFCVICARQNLKSGLFQQCVIGWLFITDVPEVAWSAHELRTSLNAQTELYRTLESPALSGYLVATGNRGLYDTNGKERIELNTGQTVWFQTRTRDGGRGLGKPKVIIDEAFKFKARTAGALLPILLAQHEPQLLYGSSEPPVDDQDADVLRDVMDRGQNHKSPELSYLHWQGVREPCADPDCTHPKDAMARGLDCALDREHLILAANPTVHRDAEGRALDTGRITLGTIRNLRQELPISEYMRECMSWPEEKNSSDPVFGVGRWEGCASDAEFPARPAAIGIGVSVDRLWASIASAAYVEDKAPDGTSQELPFVAATDRREDVGWVAREAARIQGATGCLVVLDEKGPAGDLIDELEKAGVSVTKVSPSTYATACAEFFDRVREHTLLHPSSAELNAAVDAATWRTVGERLAWARKNTGGVEISMLEAATCAVYGTTQAQAPFFGGWR